MPSLEIKTFVIGAILLIGPMFLWIGLTFGNRYLRFHLSTYAIMEAGIVQDGKLTPWSRVARFYGVRQPSVPGIQLQFNARGLLPFDRWLPSNQGLSEAEYEKLVNEVRRMLRDQTPRPFIG